MKFKQIAEMEPADLQKKFVELQKELMKLRGSVATGAAPKNPGQIKQIKRTIARIHTTLQQRGVQLNG